jgi:hypothetical protein
VNALWKRLAGLVLALAAGFSAGVPAQEQRAVSPQELDRLLAPVALYPDALLSQVLMASTYPLEVVQAARWTQANPDLGDEALEQALAAQDWDPSVKALVPFPQVLEMMSERLDWTQRLGDAVLAQQDQVMATVQQLRRKAREAGNLATTRQQTVVVEPDLIVIEPADPEVVYVPVYNPTIVYGSWWWPAPPYAWYPRSYVVGSGVVTGVSFGLGVAVGHYLWGGFDWHHRKIHVHRDVDVVRNVTLNRSVNVRRDVHRVHDDDRRARPWEHDPAHRRGVRYRDYATRERFGGASGERAREPASRARFAASPAWNGRAGDVGSPRLRKREPASAAGGLPQDGRPWADRRPTPSVEGGLASEHARHERPAADPGRLDPRRDALRQRFGEPQSPALRAGRAELREPLSPGLRAGQEPRRAGAARLQASEPTSTPMLPLAREGRERARSRPEASTDDASAAPMLPLAREGRERPRSRPEASASDASAAPMLPLAREGRERARSRPEPSAGEAASAPMLPLAREGRERSRPRAEPSVAQPAPMLPSAREDRGRGGQWASPQARGGADGGGRAGPGSRREGWQPFRDADRGGGRDLARGQGGR